MTGELDEFRQDVRAWLLDNCPHSMRTPMPDNEIPWGGKKAVYPNPETKLWLDKMVERGWTAPDWPKEYGGAGLDAEQCQVLLDELSNIKARPALFSFGYWMLGPVLLEYGNDQQKRRFLPAIARGEIRWCQGYSEPGAGSDLASLKMKAIKQSDHYIVNGSKIWTSEAKDSDWIFCLVRTDSSGSKHQGISFLLINLQSQGVKVQPIKLISGSSHFNQTFFDDVKVPVDQCVGVENEGWTIAKKLLSYERQNVAGAAFGADVSQNVWDIARKYSSTDDGNIEPSLRSRIAGQTIRANAIDILTRRMQLNTQQDKFKGLDAVLKISAAANNQLRSELIIESMGASGLGWEGEPYTEDEISNVRAWLRSRGNSIEGGTSEINMNVIAKHVLRLPEQRLGRKR